MPFRPQNRLWRIFLSAIASSTTSRVLCGPTSGHFVSFRLCVSPKSLDISGHDLLVCTSCTSFRNGEPLGAFFRPQAASFRTRLQRSVYVPDLVGARGTTSILKLRSLSKKFMSTCLSVWVYGSTCLSVWVYGPS